MFRKTWRAPKIDFPEVHTYSEDLKTITELRNKLQVESEERKRYDTTLEIMQKVMIRLNERGLK